MTVTAVRTAEDEIADAWQEVLAGALSKTTFRELAERLDTPVCDWCSTPHDVTVRSCCDDRHCDDHERDHDITCADFAAQLRENR